MSRLGIKASLLGIKASLLGIKASLQAQKLHLVYASNKSANRTTLMTNSFRELFRTITILVKKQQKM